MRHTPERCDLEDPDCCKQCAKNQNGRYFKCVVGADYCILHCGATHAASNKKKKANHYRLQVWQRRLEEFAGHGDVKSLRDEIGILRIVLEETLNSCQDSKDLLLYSAKISDLATKIEKLVTSCDRLEKNMGQMMDRPTALRFAAKLVDIVGRHVTDADMLDAISSEVLEELR